MSQEYNYTDPLNLVVAFLLGTIGIFGVVCNALIVYVFFKEKSKRTAFNVICFFRALSNILILTTIFLITYLPQALLGYSPYPPAIESWFINTSNPLYLGNEHQIVLIAMNRFCAMFFPTKYSRIFSLFHTTIILVLIYLSRIAQEIYEWLPWSAKGCYKLFSTEDFVVKYISAPDCDWVDNAPKIIKYTFIATAILNFITFLKILHFYKFLEHYPFVDIFLFIMIIFNEKLAFLKTKIKKKIVLPIIGGGHPRQGQTSVTTYSYGNNFFNTVNN
nr:protein F59B1.5 [imported] - Caenorhabditis elegans [Caenorhabditis elegans]